jgi:sarcosine oxidase subunit gamma
VKKVTGAEMPGRAPCPRQGRSVAWMSPDELLILCDHDAADQIVAELAGR